MAQGPTNVNLIATYIHNNPGCRRVDLKRMLHKAATGEHTDRQSHLDRKNQYFQRYGSAHNAYLDRLWYNEHDQGTKQIYNSFGSQGDRNYTRKSSYQLTWEGREKVFSKERLIRPFEEGSLVEWQWWSPHTQNRGWMATTQGLVVERTDLYGLWVMPIGPSTREDGQLIYVSHQAFVRRCE